MKKTLKTILVLAMALALCCNAAFASSKTSVTELEGRDQSGNKVTVTATDSSVTLTEEKAAEIIGNVKASDLTAVSIQDLHSDTVPVTITFSVDSDDTLYVFRYNGTEWELVGQGENGKATVTFDEKDPTIALVVGKPEAPEGPGKKNNSGKSYKTGEDSVVLGGSAVALAAGVVAAFARKKEA